MTTEEQLAGQTVALVALGVLSLLVVATNPFALLFALPALHIWLWLPQLAPARPTVRVLAFAAGLVGPALVLLSLGIRFGLGFDAPWYLLELVALGYVSLTPVVIALAGGAAASQLAAAAAGRYAPYPDTHERAARGPIRNAVRAVVLSSRRRRLEAERRRAIGG